MVYGEAEYQDVDLQATGTGDVDTGRPDPGATTSEMDGVWTEREEKHGTQAGVCSTWYTGWCVACQAGGCRCVKSWVLADCRRGV